MVLVKMKVMIMAHGAVVWAPPNSINCIDAIGIINNAAANSPCFIMYVIILVLVVFVAIVVLVGQ